MDNTGDHMIGSRLERLPFGQSLAKTRREVGILKVVEEEVEEEEDTRFWTDLDTSLGRTVPYVDILRSSTYYQPPSLSPPTTTQDPPLAGRRRTSKIMPHNVQSQEGGNGSHTIRIMRLTRKDVHHTIT